MSQGSAYGIPIDTDGTLSANSDFLIPSQKAVKTYVDTEIAGIPTPTTPDLEDVLTQGNDGGGLEITNIADPTTAQSAVTRQYFEDNLPLETRVLDTQFSLASTATTSEEILYAYEITGSTLAVNNELWVYVQTRKTSGSGAWNGKIYLNNANSLTGATQYGAVWGYSAANINSRWESRIWMSGASAQVGQPSTAGVQWSATGLGGTSGSSSYSLASSIWVLISSTKAVAGDNASIIVARTLLIK